MSSVAIHVSLRGEQLGTAELRWLDSSMNVSENVEPKVRKCGFSEKCPNFRLLSLLSRSVNLLELAMPAQ